MSHPLLFDSSLSTGNTSFDFPEAGFGPRVLLAYEDLEMGFKGMDVFASIARAAGVESEVQVSPWPLDALDCPRWRQSATVHAEKADIVMLALHCDRDLPVSVTTWVDQWIQCREYCHGALVAIVDSAHTRSELSSRLQAAAEKAGMAFFYGGASQRLVDTSPDPRVLAMCNPGDAAVDWLLPPAVAGQRTSGQLAQ